MMEEEEESRNTEIMQNIYKSLSSEKLSKMFFNETIIKDSKGQPKFEMTTLVSIRRKKELESIPRRMNVTMAID